MIEEFSIWLWWKRYFRSGRSAWCSTKEVSLKFCKVYRKNPVLGSLFKVACNFIKKWLQHRYFPADFDKSLRTPVLRNTSRRLLDIIKRVLYNGVATNLSEIRSIILIVKGRKGVQNKLRKCVIWYQERPSLFPGNSRLLFIE